MVVNDSELDRTEDADARRFRWLLNGNSHFPEELGVCGNYTVTSADKDALRAAIDEEMGQGAP